jgi:hypothetical protein
MSSDPSKHGLSPRRNTRLGFGDLEAASLAAPRGKLYACLVGASAWQQPHQHESPGLFEDRACSALTAFSR